MIYIILFAHWLNDFVGQNQILPSLEIGKNKSKSWRILGLHVNLYTTGMALCLWPFMGPDAWTYALVNGVTHLGIDAVTSRVSSRAYANGKTALFWNTIGFDQFLHVAILCGTLELWNRFQTSF